MACQDRSGIEAVLDVARWAPSGDNAQPWRFRITGDLTFEIVVRRSRGNVYEYRQGEPTLISTGALLANIELAAPAFGLKALWRYIGTDNGGDRIEVVLEDAPGAAPPDLFDQIKRRSVDRRRFRLQPLTAEQKRSLSAELQPGMEIQWYESLTERSKIAALTALATNIRLSIPETFEIHRNIVDWKNRHSEHAIPARALGLDPLTLRLTRWSLEKWSRTQLVNGLGGPRMAAFQMDFLPGICSAAYFTIRFARGSREPGAVAALEAGRAIQRFWLRATKLGLAVQPCVAMLAFWSYAAAGEAFTGLPAAQSMAQTLMSKAEAILGGSHDLAFIGRIGLPRSLCGSRSLRFPLARLIDQSV